MLRWAFADLRRQACLALLALAPINAAADPLVTGECALVAGETGIVVEIVDAMSVRLDSGLDVRLSGIERPYGADEGAAIAALTTLAKNQPVELAYGEIERDRYGRALAHAFLVDGAWIQTELLAGGHAVATGYEGQRDCLAELLAAEEEARTTRAGFWSLTSIPDAWSDAIRSGPDRFAIVEGRVISIGRTENTVYLNFGRNWSDDLTVTIRSDHADMIETEAGSFDRLEGAVIRVRGWLSQRDGPWIRVDHGGQIEIVSPSNAAVAN